jgi:hypothetical protein
LNFKNFFANKMNCFKCTSVLFSAILFSNSYASTELESALQNLNESSSLPIVTNISLLKNCSPNLFNSSKCEIPFKSILSAEKPLTMPWYAVGSLGTHVRISFDTNVPDYSFSANVNGQECPLHNGINTCAIPSDSKNLLTLSITASSGGKPTGSSPLQIRHKSPFANILSVNLEAGKTKVLERIFFAGSLIAADLEKLLEDLDKAEKEEFYKTKTKQELNGLIQTLTINRIPGMQLLDWNKPIFLENEKPSLNEFGVQNRNRTCPMVNELEPTNESLWSHRMEECQILWTLQGILDGNTNAKPREAIKFALHEKLKALQNAVISLQNSVEFDKVKLQELVARAKTELGL